MVFVLPYNLALISEYFLNELKSEFQKYICINKFITESFIIAKKEILNAPF